MKLRQKLAVVLASAMVVTAVPVVTMAESTNSINKSAKTLKKNTFTTDGSIAVKIKFKDYDPAKVEEFFLELENAEWVKGDSAELKAQDGVLLDINEDDNKIWTVDIDGAEAEYYRQSDSTVRVRVAAGELNDEDLFKFPIFAKVTGGSAKVTIVNKGASTVSDGWSSNFTSTGEDEAKVVAADPTNFFKKGKLADVTFKDEFANSIATAEDGFCFELELDDPDYAFYDIDNIEIEGKYGYADLGTQTISELGATYELDPDDNKDYGRLRITLPNSAFGTLTQSSGEIVLKNVWVKTSESEPDTGDFIVNVSGKEKTDLVDGGDLVLGKVVEYSHYIEMNDEKVVDIKAGRQEDVKFKVGEYIDNCFTGGRDLEITLSNPDAFFIVDDFAKECAAKGNDGYTFDDQTWIKKLITDSEKDLDLTVEAIEFKWADDHAPSDMFNADGTAKKDNDTAKATTIIVTMSQKTNDDEQNINTNGKEDWFKVETKVYVPVDQKDKGSIKLLASGNAMTGDTEQEAISIKNPFDVVIEPTTLKVGLQEQVGGKITITETDKGQFEKGMLVMDVAAEKKGGDGIEIEDKGTFTLSAGDLKKTDFDKTEQELTLEFKRQSKAAATLVFDQPSITVDRSVPQGTYDLKLSGSAIDKYDGSLKVEDFIIIPTANTQDIQASNGLAKGTASFTIGSASYTANDGSVVTMDAAPFIQDPGYTMVPVKYVALAFGITEDCISYAGGNIAIMTGSKTIGLERGSNIANVNGVKVPLSTAVTIKDGRTYAPIADVAKILGITPNWDNATKTATFTNN